MIEHSQPTVEEEDLSRVRAALSNKCLSAGDITRSFVKKLTSFFSAEEVFLLPTGTAAITAAIKLLNKHPRGEVIIPAYVCQNVAKGVQLAGAIPITVDINKDDYNLSFVETEKKVSSNTVAIIMPHMFGCPIRDMDKFSEIGVPLVEDIAHSIGGSNRGGKLGSLTTLSICSFYATKIMTTGEGGALIINSSKDLAVKDNQAMLNYYKMSDFQAALGLAQLKKLGAMISRRREIASYYYNELAKVDGLELFPDQKASIHYRFIVRMRKKDALPKVIAALADLGVRAARFTDIVLNYLGLDPGQYPNTRSALERDLSIPIYPSLSDKDREKVVQSLAKVMKGIR